MSLIPGQRLVGERTSNAFGKQDCPKKKQSYIGKIDLVEAVVKTA